MMRRSTTSMPATAGEIDDGRSRDAGEETVGDRRMDRSVLDEEDVGAGAFGDSALPVHHQRVGVAAAFRAMLGDGADHVEAGRFRERRRGRGIGSPIVGDIEPDALHPLRRVEIARPIPDGDAEMDRVVLRRHAHHLRSAPGDRPHVGVGEIVAPQGLGLGRVDLVDSPRESRSRGCEPNSFSRRECSADLKMRPP